MFPFHQYIPPRNPCISLVAPAFHQVCYIFEVTWHLFMDFEISYIELNIYKVFVLHVTGPRLVVLARGWLY